MLFSAVGPTTSLTLARWNGREIIFGTLSYLPDVFVRELSRFRSIIAALLAATSATTSLLRELTTTTRGGGGREVRRWVGRSRFGRKESKGVPPLLVRGIGSDVRRRGGGHMNELLVAYIY